MMMGFAKVASGGMRPSRLALRFATFIIVFSSVIAAAITAVELAIDYRDDLRAIDARLQQIETSHLDSLAENLWVMDRERLDTQLQGILRLPDFVLAEIRVNEEVLMRRGRELDGAGVTRRFGLQYTHRGVAQKLGEFVIDVSYRGALERVLDRLLFRLAANGFKTFLVGIFIFLLFQRLIARHLDRIAAYAGDETEEWRKPPLALERADHVEDELTQVARTINQSRKRLLDLLAQEQRRSDEHAQQAALLRQELLARKKIQNELRLMAQLFQDSPDATLITDAQCCIVAANDAFHYLTGYDQHELLGSNPRVLASGQTDPGVFRDMWAALNLQGFWEGGVQDQHKDGHLLLLRVAIRAIRDHNDQVLNYVAIYRGR